MEMKETPQSIYSPKELHIKNKKHKKNHCHNGCILVDHSLPRQFLCSPFKFLTFCHKIVADVGYILQFFAFIGERMISIDNKLI
jgi:hypothetical protein